MSNSTLEFYDKNAEQYKFATQKLDFTAIYDSFLDQLPSGAYILDFGCGNGHDTKYFLENGYQVEAVDGSVEMCKIASEYTGIKIKQMLFDELSEEEKYMGVWACASVLHLQKENLKIVLKKMHTALKGDGVVYISFKYGDFSGERDGRYFTDFTEKSFSELIWEIGGFSIIDLWKTDDLSLNRRKDKWLNILLKKRSVHDELIGRDLDKEKLDLTRKGVDFWNSFYSEHADFMKLKEAYYFVNHRHIRADLLVEQSLGQKHLEKLYGPYSIKIKRPLTENEASEEMFYNHAKEEFGYYEWSIHDTKKLFWRNETERAGICTRLLEWGLNINDFDDNSEKFRLMKFLYGYEYNNGVRFKSFVEKPTMENADQSHIKHKTRNGEIMNDLKENVAVVIDGNYVAELKQTLYSILLQWEKVLRGLAQIRGRYSSEIVINELKQLHDRIEPFAKLSEDIPSGEREETLYKQFYLKLCIHEIIGREYDIINVIENALEYKVNGNKINLDDNIVWIPKDGLQEYCKNNRERLAKLLYNKDKINSNNYRDFDKAAKKACYGINFFWEETGFRSYEKMPEYLLIISIQEVLIGDMKDRAKNYFYRYQTSDQKTLSAELSSEDTFDKSKLVWIERVKKRVSSWNAPTDVYFWEKKIELLIEKIILQILNSNSIEVIKSKNERYLALINWLAITQEQLQSVRDIIHVQTGFRLSSKDSFAERIFLGFLWDSEDLREAWIGDFINAMKWQMCLGNKVYKRLYPLEYENNKGVYYGCQVILEVDFSKRTITELLLVKLEICKDN